jgi:hypothetical protein
MEKLDSQCYLEMIENQNQRVDHREEIEVEMIVLQDHLEGLIDHPVGVTSQETELQDPVDLTDHLVDSIDLQADLIETEVQVEVLVEEMTEVGIEVLPEDLVQEVVDLVEGIDAHPDVVLQAVVLLEALVVDLQIAIDATDNLS